MRRASGFNAEKSCLVRHGSITEAGTNPPYPPAWSKCRSVQICDVRDKSSLAYDAGLTGITRILLASAMSLLLCVPGFTKHLQVIHPPDGERAVRLGLLCYPAGRLGGATATTRTVKHLSTHSNPQRKDKQVQKFPGHSHSRCHKKRSRDIHPNRRI